VPKAGGLEEGQTSDAADAVFPPDDPDELLLHQVIDVRATAFQELRGSRHAAVRHPEDSGNGERSQLPQLDVCRSRLGIDRSLLKVRERLGNRVGGYGLSRVFGSQPGDDGQELADVSRPVVGLESFDGSAGSILAAGRSRSRHPAEMVVDQLGDVLLAPAERCQPNLLFREAGSRDPPEFSLPDQGPEVLVGGDDDPDGRPPAPSCPPDAE